MKKDIDTQFLCKDCERYNLCEYYYNRKKDSYICKYFHLPNKLDKIRAEIDRQEKWLLQAGYTAYNVDIAFDSIKSVLAESEEDSDGNNS